MHFARQREMKDERSTQLFLDVLKDPLANTLAKDELQRSARIGQIIRNASQQVLLTLIDVSDWRRYMVMSKPYVPSRT